MTVFRDRGLPIVLDEIRSALTSFGVEFDVWFSELSLEASGAREQALKTLRAQGHVYEQDGAVWLRTTDFKDDKDRVLIKSDGASTYFLSDAAYYVDKRERGFAPCIYLLGADHHGYVGRLRALLVRLLLPGRSSGLRRWASGSAARRTRRGRAS